MADTKKVQKQFLVLADKTDAELARKAGGSDGQDDLIERLRKDPLAVREIEQEIKRLRRNKTSVDHINLTRYNGTDLVQWMGRFSNGYHYPLGALMKIETAISKAKAPAHD